MTTERPEALRLASDIAASGQFTNLFTLDAAAAELRTQHARITALESQLAQRFDAADMATAAAQGFRDGVASVSAQAADSVQEEAARLDFLIEQGAYVVSDPDACAGYWLHWARPDGSTWVQIGEYPTPRAAIDEARKQEASKEPDGSLPCGH